MEVIRRHWGSADEEAALERSGRVKEATESILLQVDHAGSVKQLA
jgi:hypothetical protein